MVSAKEPFLTVAIRKANSRMENFTEWASGEGKVRTALGGHMKVTLLRARRMVKGSESIKTTQNTKDSLRKGAGMEKAKLLTLTVE